jgi:hypothetical protein
MAWSDDVEDRVGYSGRIRFSSFRASHELTVIR